MLTKEEANRITNRQIGKTLGSIKEVINPVPQIYADSIISHFHFLKKDLTPYLEWEDGLDKTTSNTI